MLQVFCDFFTIFANEKTKNSKSTKKLEEYKKQKQKQKRKLEEYKKTKNKKENSKSTKKLGEYKKQKQKKLEEYKKQKQKRELEEYKRRKQKQKSIYMMKKRLLMMVVLLLCMVQAQAVLKEKDLPHTLGVLKAELKADFEKQKMFMQRYEQMSTAQHAQLISNMKRCEQIGLILYSQKADFTFDMAYACQEATKLYFELQSSNAIPYDKIKVRVKHEIERYTELIALLKQMPPAVGEAKDSVSAVDSLLLSEADSLEGPNAARPSPMMQKPDEEEEVKGPFQLEGEELQDRLECLYYAQELMSNLQSFLEKFEEEQGYYDQVSERASKLNEFAQSRYKILQQSIFKDGGSNYFSILASLPMQLMQVKRDLTTKYAPLEKTGVGRSEWRGVYVGFISMFMLIYIGISILLSNVIVRWLLPKRFRGQDFKQKRQMFIVVLGIAIFALSTMVAHRFANINIVAMGTSLMITFAWLMEVIFLSLLIRLDASQMKKGARIYTPFIMMALLVILFRIVLIPNSLVNLIYPPILLAFTIWQGRVMKKNREGMPTSDMFYSTISFVTMIVATVAAWVGYTLLAVEIMMWWMFQLTFIQTITCIYDLMKMYEQNRQIYSLKPEMKAMEKAGMDTTEIKERLVRHIKKGEYIHKTWMYDFMHKAAVPILGVISVLASIFLAAQIFEMTSLCIEVFFKNFIDEPKYLSLSLFKICLVAGTWFMFSYLNYAIKAGYHHFRRKTLGDSAEDYNGTLANNVIAILVWGSYFIFSLILLRVPSTGISVVTAGLATGMGFAMKDLLENFFYGISLMSGRVRVGDYIECDGIRGKVEKITYQSTMILTMDGCIIAILNSALFSKNFKNLTRNHQYELVKIPVGVAYGSNVDKVREMLIMALEPECAKENKAGKRVTDENTKITVAFSNFGDNSVDLLVCIWMLVEETAGLTGRCKEIIYNTLNQHDINIPFPQRDVYIHEFPGAKNE